MVGDTLMEIKTKQYIDVVYAGKYKEMLYDFGFESEAKNGTDITVSLYEEEYDYMFEKYPEYKELYEEFVVSLRDLGWEGDDITVHIWW